MSFANARTFALMSCLIMVGCREAPEAGRPADAAQVFPDPAPAVAATATPVDLAGALALEPGQVGQFSAGDLASAREAGRCSLDSINEVDASEAVVGRGEPTRFSGWVASAADSPAVAILLVGGESYAVAGASQAERADVAAAIGLESGKVFDFQANVALGPVVPGAYAVHLLHQDAEGLVRCALNRSVTVE